jgi:teichuronic acid biosynthesis glycosyltransferase TuaH
MENLLFVPYHDIYDFDNSGIMTREYAMLWLLLESKKINELYCIGKPRTLLDAKYFNKVNEFPEKSYEYSLKQKISESKHFRYFTYINSGIFFKKRAWWPKGYNNLIKKIEKEKINLEKTIVYSNNPFSYSLLEYCHKRGARIIFDMMDNFYVHPSLSKNEREVALKGYSKIANFAQFFSCNSLAIKEFCQSAFSIDPILIKNGVFSPRITETLNLSQYESLLKEQKKYKRTVGYIGKLGKRIDEDLVAEISNQCSDTLFVFIGPHLDGQKNKKLINLLNHKENILYLGPISSVYIYSFLDRFDILSIPHAVGERENGGDPLKLYQYLNTEKTIITTPILGVDEFSSFIKIASNPNDWVTYINKEEYKFQNYKTPSSIYWDNRAKELINFL